MTNRLIIVGSPRVDGRSASLAELLFEACIEDHPDEEVALVPVSTLAIEGCMGCNACKPWEYADAANVGDAAEGVGADADAAAESTGCASDANEERIDCVLEDDMQDVYPLIDAADELVIVSPVYFGSAPSQLKALLDRLQPYYWTDARRTMQRPATLHVVGEGGDPHGFDALITTVKSACAVAGFQLTRVLDWVGRIDDQGEIVEEAAEYDVSPRRARIASHDVFLDSDTSDTKPAAAPQAVSPQRPKLRLDDTQAGGGKKQASGTRGQSQSKGQGQSRGQGKGKDKRQAAGQGKGSSRGRAGSKTGGQGKRNQGKAAKGESRGKGGKRRG